MASVRMWKCDRAGTMVPQKDEVIEERVLSVYVNGTLGTRLAASDGLAEEAALGHAIGEGWATSEQVLSVTAEGTSVFLRIAPEAVGAESPGTEGIDCVSVQQDFNVVPASPGLTVSAENLLRFAEEMQRGAQSWRATGGVHAALIAQGDSTFICEDISRHTSMDKAIGHALMYSWDLSKCVLMGTGRIPAQAVAQAARARIPILASRSATTAQAVALAERLGITLVAFVRAGRMNIYSRPDRIDS
jgi:FdhD protein